MDFLLIVCLTLLNAVFAMSELALTASRKARLSAMSEAGDLGAKTALALLAKPDQYLSTVQVGITSIGVLYGIVGEAAFSPAVSLWLQGLGISETVSEISATAVVVTLITFVTIIFGELVPKRIGQLYPEPVARWVARPMLWLATAARPFVSLLSFTTQAVLKLMRIDTTVARAVTEEEITASLAEGRDAGLIEKSEHQMVQNVFNLGERPLTSMMVPRSDVQWLDASDTAAQSLARLASNNPLGAHSWYPVCRGSLENVVGIISVGQLLVLAAGPAQAISEQVQSAVFLPETLTVMELLEQFRTRANRMVFVVDEYGVVQGLVTQSNLLEAITGELHPKSQAEAWAVARSDGSWLIDGLMPVSELKARFELKDLPEEERGRYNTVAGLLMSVTGHLPRLGECIDCMGWRFEVLDLDGKRIDKVLASRVDSVNP
ncbi:MAG: hemolysin family protein [Burkholderiaceae bacterium]